MLALAAIAAFFLFIIGTVIFRKSLGDLTITSTSVTLEPGDEIDAQLVLTASRKLAWNAVTISLRCTDLADRGGSLPSREIYRDTHVLAGAGGLQSGGKQTFAVRFVVPTRIEPSGLSIDATEAVDQLPDVVAGFLEAHSEAISERRKFDITWDLVAEVERDGVGMFDSHPLEINLLPSLASEERSRPTDSPGSNEDLGVLQPPK